MYARMARNPLGFVGDRFERYGDLYYAPGPDGDLYVLRHPDHLREVLVTRASDYRKEHTAFARLSVVLGDGLLTTDGDVWRRQRRLVQPAFSRERLAEYAQAMTDEAMRTLDSWQPATRVNMSREMMELTLRIVGRTLFSHDVAGDADAVARAMTTFQDSVLRPDVLPRWVPSPARRRLARSVADLDHIILTMVRERREGNARKPDLLQRLVDARDEDQGDAPLTDREVRDQLVTLFLAGHETTSHALSWAWHLLALNPREEARLHGELDRVLGGRPATFEDLPALTYTGWVVRETMRLYPPVYVLARRAAHDTIIGDFAVQAGAEVVCWLWHTHRDPRWWPDPERFRPERFHPDEESNRPRLAWVPFGAGPRTCIGKHFALQEAQLLLATLAQRYAPRHVPGAPVRPLPRVTLRPKGGLPMMLDARR